jgi:hypothetical protein
MKFLILIMALLANGKMVIPDGDPALADQAFFRVDTRNPAHVLAPGVAADATNKRFEQGQAWPRYGVDQQPWGLLTANLAAGLAWGRAHQGDGLYTVEVYGFVVGRKYTYAPIESTQLTTAQAVQVGGVSPGGVTIDPGVFTATQQTYYLWAAAAGLQAVAVKSKILITQSAQGYRRFNDPNGFNVTVLLTDDWRDGAGEDGGRGRAWKIQSGNVPVLIPLNGHDIYGTARLVPCKGALALLRQDNERHYFNTGAIAPAAAAGTVQLNCAPAWKNGEAAIFWADPSNGSALTGGVMAPASGGTVWVKNIGNNQVELYQDSGLANKFDFTGAVAGSRFYLERASATPGFYGNGAPPLIAQPDVLGNSLFDVGFVAVPVDVFATALSVDSKTLTVPNHRLAPGDSVNYFHAGASTGLFVNPINANQIVFFDTAVHALLNAKNGSVVGQQTVLFAAGDYVVKTGASALPAPPAREGFYTSSERLVLVNGKNNIWISDPSDPLHGTPYTSSFAANLGEADSVVAVSGLTTSDTLVFFKQDSILGLFNVSGGAAAWDLRKITDEYGCKASLSVVAWGTALYFLSRRGLDRVEFNTFGNVVPAYRAVSEDMKRYIDLIDWNSAWMACCETWNNRLFLSFASRGQVLGAVVNDTVLVLNFLNSNVQEHQYGWEGAWTGPALKVVGWARHNVFGEERLTFADFNGNVNWLGDGAMDLGLTPVADSLTTRIYAAGNKGRKIWQTVAINWQTNNALLTVTAQTPGYKENLVLAAGFAYDRTKYAAGEGADYNPATQVPPFTNPYRQDYSLAGAGELIGGQPDVHQDHNEPFRMRLDDWGVQLVIGNTRGSARISSVEVGGFVGPSSERSTV